MEAGAAPCANVTGATNANMHPELKANKLVRFIVLTLDLRVRGPALAQSTIAPRTASSSTCPSVRGGGLKGRLPRPPFSGVQACPAPLWGHPSRASLGGRDLGRPAGALHALAQESLVF